MATPLRRNDFGKRGLFRIMKILRVPDDFHCRFQCVGRSYLYRIAVPRLHQERGLNPMSAIHHKLVHMTK